VSDNVIYSSIDRNPNTPFHFPQSLTACVTKVLSGEYNYPVMPDEPRIRRVLDIGANVGAAAAWMYKRYKTPWIECYEPHPGAAELCEKNAPPGARVHRLAVSAKAPEPVKLFIGADWGYNSLAEGLTVQTGEAVEVPAIHPRDLPPADAIKLDTEGSEVEILQHWPHLAACSVVLYEFHREEDVPVLDRICREAGLHLVRFTLDRIDLGIAVWVRTKARYNWNRDRYEVNP
jgi:FkbM family methyltransferase